MLYYIGIGSNLGDRLANIKKAIVLLKENQKVQIKRISFVYETEAEGGPKGQGDYLNAVLEMESLLEPKQLLSTLQSIERQAGRKPRGERWAAREVDLDILLCGNRMIKEEGLEIPHPRMHERSFVLKPLNDLDPKVKHPVLEETVSGLLDRMDLRGRMRKIEEIISID